MRSFYLFFLTLFFSLFGVLQIIAYSFEIQQINLFVKPPQIGWTWTCDVCGRTDNTFLERKCRTTGCSGRRY